MNFLFTLFGTPLGFIMWGCYLVVQNIGIAIMLFTLIVRVAMFPISVKQQKNTSKSQLFAPRVKEIQQKHRGNTQKMQEEMQKLQKEGYNPVGGCLPMILTMIILFGVLDVVYKPMTYFERIPSNQIEIVIDEAINIEAKEFIVLKEESGEEIGENDEENKKTDLRKRQYVPLRAELRAIGVFTDNPEAFENSEITGETYEKLDRLGNRIVFLGVDFSKIPYWNPADSTKENPYFPLILIPLLSFIFSIIHTIVMQIIQRKTSPESVQQMGSMKYMLYFMPVISLMIAFQFPAGAGFYWSVSSLIAIAQSLIIFRMYPPEKIKAEVLATLEKQGFKSDNVVVVEKYDKETNEMVATEKKASEMSSKEQKEYYRKKLEQARKQDLEKYGEVEKSSKNPENYKEEE
jgi:YidC/Oxa1 family membrane protein insertase